MTNHHVYKVVSITDTSFGRVYFADYDQAIAFANDFNDTFIKAIDLGFPLPSNKMDLHDYFVFLNDTNITFTIDQSDETGELLWIVYPTFDPDYWMGSWGTQEEAIEFCQRLDLKIEE